LFVCDSLKFQLRYQIATSVKQLTCI